MPANVIVPDAGWCNPDDLWGIGIDGFSCPLPNPSIKSPSWAAAVLDNHGIKLSTNPKTILCFNTLQEFTCWPSELCEEMCYGWSINFRNTRGYDIFSRNVDAMFKHWSDQDIRDIAHAIKAICFANDLDNIRWHGIGDLVGRGIEIDLLTALTDDEDFLVYGFTRKGNVLMKLPVRDNLVFWCSMDETMDVDRLEIQAEAAVHHKTMLAYATYHGTAYGSRTRDGKPTPPWFKPTKLKKPTVFYSPEPDPLLERLVDGGFPISVVFGYHGSGRLTHVGVPDECPGTDPLAGGHFLGTCLVCGWCLQKPHNRELPSLKKNRERWVDADSFTGKNFGEIYLDTGEQR
jgi:hypothetical protein